LLDQRYAMNTPVFFEIGRLGTLVSRIVDYEANNEIDRPNIGSAKVAEIGNGILRGAGKPVSTALILTHLGKEQGCIKKNGQSLEKVLPEAMGVKTDDQAIKTWLLDQLIRGIAVTRKKYYEVNDKFPLVTKIAKKENDNYFYNEPDKAKKKIKVKFTIKNKATMSLLSYTPFVTSEPVPKYGGNALFWWFWDEFGFNR